MPKSNQIGDIDYKIYTILMTVAVPHYGHPDTPTDASLFVRLDEEAFMLGYEEAERKLS
jgi:hypothetical protein